jgi:hypothetical protein
MTYLDEAQVEIATVDYFRELGYEYIHGAHIAPDLPAPGAARQAGGEADGSHREAVRKVECPCC